MNQNIREILYKRFINTPDRLVFSYINTRSGNINLSYRDLWEQSYRLALVLQKLTKENEVILVTIKPSIHYIVTIFSCILAGRTFLPTYPTISKQDMERTDSLIKRYSIPLVIDDSTAEEWEGQFSCLSYTIEELYRMGQSISGGIKLENTPLANPLFLQASSGTTRYPKAIIIDNECLIAGLSNMKEALSVTDQDIGCSWLPPYHDMGLIGCIFLAVYGNFPVHFMSSSSFILDPLSWLKLIDQLKVTITAAPNLAYDLCAARFQTTPLQGLDLKSLRVAINGSEMIRAKTINKFSQVFQQSGFNRRMFRCAYGLAEATLMVTCNPLNSEPHIQSFLQTSLHQGVCIPCSADDQNAIQLVSSGSVVPNMICKIVDRNTQELRQAYEVGEIWVKGTSLTRGYYQDEEKTTENYVLAPFEEGEIYIRTGDSGFKDDQGQLFVIGRIKDLIKTPHGLVSAEEIEHVIDDLLSLDPSYRTTAIIIENQLISEIIIIKEVPKNKDFTNDTQRIYEYLKKLLSVRISKVIYARRGQIPRTKSGKTKRHAAIILLKYDLLDIFDTQVIGK